MRTWVCKTLDPHPVSSTRPVPALSVFITPCTPSEKGSSHVPRHIYLLHSLPVLNPCLHLASHLLACVELATA